MKPKFLIAAILSLYVASTPLWTVASTVKEGNVDQTLVQLLLNDQGLKGDANQRTAIEKQLALQDILVKRAQELQLDKQQDVQNRIEMSKRVILVQAYWKDYFNKNPITDEVTQNAYQKLHEINGNQQYHLSHIVVDSTASAKKAIAMLKTNSFAVVAKKMSLDNTSKDKGGDLGWQWKSDINPVVLAKLSGAKAGKVLEPIQVPSGNVVVVRLDNIRDENFPAYSQIKQTIQNMLQQQIEQQQLEKMTQ